ncbi:hypothetical protein [Prosthecobacter sp.]|uniref:hypothetical protein n=1 Tax=Prosthecobacter sp. TaxID=1965333 RepID=UPI003784E067
MLAEESTALNQPASLPELVRMIATMWRRLGGADDRSVSIIRDVQATAMHLEQPLLAEMDKGFSDAWWTNYRTLVIRRDEGNIAPDEMRELMALTDTLEEVNVRRMACFASASRLLGMSLDELMEKADLKPKLA